MFDCLDAFGYYVLVISCCQKKKRKTHRAHQLLVVGMSALLGRFVWVFGRQFDAEKA